MPFFHFLDDFLCEISASVQHQVGSGKGHEVLATKMAKKYQIWLFWCILWLFLLFSWYLSNKTFAMFLNVWNKFKNNNNEEYKKYLNNPVNHSLLLYRINQDEIKNAIINLKNSNSSGHDDITSKFVKISSPILIPALERIFNL